jgi:plastocyanin
VYTNRLRVWSITALVCGAVCVTSCAHPINDDGDDITNPMAHNPGITTHTLTLSVDHTDLGVGEGVAITATYDGMVLPANVPGAAPIVTVSDPSVIACCALDAFAYSVGSATLTATYGELTQTISFTVHAQNGISALVFPTGNQTTGTSSWTPPGGVFVEAGSTVQFSLLKVAQLAHNVVFDAVPGAPADITQNGSTTSANRVFPTAGIFTFTCTIHGETGMVTVVAP